MRKNRSLPFRAAFCRQPVAVKLGPSDFPIPFLAETAMHLHFHHCVSRFGLVSSVLAAAVFVLCLSATVVAQTSAEPATEPSVSQSEPAPPLDFARDVFPILQKYCLECHGPEKQEEDFRVDHANVLLTEDYVAPGDGANSRLYEVLVSVDDDHMPPPEEEIQVPEQDIATIKTWIDQGAKWSDISALLAANIGDAPQANNSKQTVAPTTKTPAPPPKDDFWVKLWRAFGDLHPATVHFPVALLVVGGLFALFGLRGSYRCSDFAFYCLWLGAISSIVSSVIGWSFAWNEGHNEDPFLFDMQARLFWHRWSAVLLSILSFLLAVWATIARRRDPDDGTIWKLGLIVLAGLTMYVGHAGGDLTHPRGYRRLFELVGFQAPANPGAARAFENALPDKSPEEK